MCYTHVLLLCVCNSFQLRTVIVISCALWHMCIHMCIIKLSAPCIYSTAKEHSQTQLQASSRTLPDNTLLQSTGLQRSAHLPLTFPTQLHVADIFSRFQTKYKNGDELHSTLGHCEYHLHVKHLLMLLSRAVISERASRGSLDASISTAVRSTRIL